MGLKKIETFIEGLVVIEPIIFSDERGFFFESYNSKQFNDLVGCKVDFVQDNQSSSSIGTIRGLHYQINHHQQGKLIRVIKGKIFDVAVDLRKNSKTFKKWFGIELAEKNFKQLWIPRGFAHGFLCLSENCEVLYKVDNYYSKEHEKGLHYKNTNLNIDWPLTDKVNISEKDKSYDVNGEIVSLDILD